MTDPRPSWDEYGLALASAASLRGDCTRRQVGAALMGRDHRILSLGYNGAAAGLPGCLSASACPRGQFTYAEIASGLGNAGHPVPCTAIHAERNCLDHYLDSREDWDRYGLDGATLFITLDPCPDCLAYIREVALDTMLSRVVTPTTVLHLWETVYTTQGEA